MTEQIVKSVREDLKSGKNIEDVLKELKESGLPSEKINSIVKDALSSEEEVRKLSSVDATKAFIIIGIILIISAAVVVIATNWTNVGAVMRVLFLAVPMVILYAISWFLSKKEQFKSYEKLVFIASSLLLPAVIGTAVYQFNIHHNVDALLAIICAASALVYSVIFEFLLKRNYMSLYTIAAVYFLLGGLTAKFINSELIGNWLAIAVSFALILLGFWFKIQKQNKNAYFVIGNFIFALSLPFTAIDTIDRSVHMSLIGKSAAVMVAGGLYLVWASFYNSISIKLADEKVIYSFKRLLEEGAAMMLVFPLLAMASEKNYIYYLAAILGVAYIFLSQRVRILTLPFAGAFTLVISILALTESFFKGSINWPIAVFLLGFLSIGLGLLIKKITKRRDEDNAGTFLGLGQDPNREVSTQGKKSFLARIIMIILFIYLFGGMMSLLSTIFFKV